MLQEQVPSSKPSWLRVKLPTGRQYQRLKKIIYDFDLHTVCESAACPNRGECWAKGTATFMILGNICTRSCGFCNVQTGRPSELDLSEPARVAEAISKLHLKHAVITSVNRDELKDGGASIWCETIRLIRDRCASTKIEILIPDFAGNFEALRAVLAAGPDIVNHNVETVPRLYATVRPQAQFERSLSILKQAREYPYLSSQVLTKSGIMVGLGEQEFEVIEVMQRLKEVGCNLLTIGQYLQPTKAHLPVQSWIEPHCFERLKLIGEQLGFKNVFAGPLVRSSYHAESQI